MSPEPLQDYVLCEKIGEETMDVKDIVVLQKETLNIYKIVKISEMLEHSKFKVGDKIVTNSTGSKLNIEGSSYYLFKLENIVSKIVE